METLLTALLVEFGPVGLVLACCGWMVYQFMKQLEVHRQDRNRWMADSERMTNRMIDALNANTATLTEVITILRERKQ